MTQPSLFDEAPQPVEALFFALIPPAGAAQRLSLLARALRQQHGLLARAQDTDRLHLSLHGLGEYAGLPPGLEERAREAAAQVRAAPFELTLDRVLSYGRRPVNCPLVLGVEDPPAALLDLHRTLGLALAKLGLGRHLTPAFSPHVTLLYDNHLLPPQPTEPQSWTVEDFVLVHSLPGQHRHTHLARWPLRG